MKKSVCLLLVLSSVAVHGGTKGKQAVTPLKHSITRGDPVCFDLPATAR